MKKWYCTYFDRNYLVKAVALVESLRQQETCEFVVFAVCHDELSRQVLLRLGIKEIIPIPMHDLEWHDKALLTAKQGRSHVEYFWTATPTIILRILERNPHIDVLTYLDSDLFFFSSSDPIYSELGDGSVLIHEHRFSPATAYLEPMSGRFNVGLLCFRNNPKGREVLGWWRDRCNEWCFARCEPGRMGDQFYLNEWPARFPHVKILQHPGGGVAPWNHDQYRYTQDMEGRIQVDGTALIFYHFHALASVSESIIVPIKHAHYPFTRQIAELVFIPYAKALEHAARMVRNAWHGFGFGLSEVDALGPEYPAIFRLSAKGQLQCLKDGEFFEATPEWGYYWPRKRMVLGAASMQVSTSPQTVASYPYKVTALVSTYKSEAFIAECLSDLVNQTIAGNLEVIVVDADSPEGEGAIVAEFQKRYPNIKYIRTPERIGVYAAWNIAIEAASGEYLISVSTNDRLRREACEIMARTLDANPSVAAVYGNTYLTGIPHQTFEQHTLAGTYLWPEYSFENLLQTCMVGPHPMWRKEVHKHVGLFDESYTAIGDQDMWLRIGEKFDLLHIPDVTGLYWVTGDSLSGNLENSNPEVEKVHHKYQTRKKYRDWMHKHSLQEIDGELFAERMVLKWKVHPEFHFVMALEKNNLDELTDTLNSLAEQMYGKWRLSILANFSCPDPMFDQQERLEWIECAANAFQERSNRLVAESSADWVSIIIPGIQFAPHYLIKCADYINIFPDWRLVYTDEDVVDQDGFHYDDKFKPDFNLDMLRSMHYLGTFFVEKSLLSKAGGISILSLSGCYDLALRVFDMAGESALGHIADVLVHMPPGVANNHDEIAEQRALSDHLHRNGVAGKVMGGYQVGTYRVVYEHADQPLVSVIIPTKDKLHLVQPCLESLFDKTDYPNFEVILVDNQSEDPDVLAFYEEAKRRYGDQLRVLEYPREFNFSAINNHAAERSRGEYLLLLNNDTMVVQAEWLSRMMAYGQRPEVGGVGARLVYPETGKLQHAGVVLGIAGLANHPFTEILSIDEPGYMNRAHIDQNYSAVTAACLLIRKSIYQQVGGMDEEKLKVLYNDVDLCLKVGQSGYKIVWTPYATVVHHGSGSINDASQDYMKLALRNECSREEREVIYERWMPKVADDPAYNRNLSLLKTDYSVEATVVIDWDTNFHDRPRILGVPLAGGVGEYRMISPFRAMSNAGMAQTNTVMSPKLFQMRVLTVTELERAKPDSLVLHTAIDNPSLEAMQIYKRYNSRIFRVFGLDDLVTQTPKKSAFHKYAFKDAKPRLRKALSLSDRLIVTTQPLADLCKGMIDDIRIIPNRLERAKWGGVSSLRGQGNKPRVGWAGAQQHDGDLELIHEVVKATAHEIDWVFFGMCPAELRPHVREFHDFVLSFEEYPAKLASLNLDLAVAPLEIHPFNEAKSNLRLLEYGIMGWPVVCTDISSYQDAPVKRVPNQTSAWIEAIRERVHDLDAAYMEGDQLRQWVLNHYILEDHLDEWLAALLRS